MTESTEMKRSGIEVAFLASHGEFTTAQPSIESQRSGDEMAHGFQAS